MFNPGKGPFQCTRMAMGETVLIVPNNLPAGQTVGIVGWANGTGGNANTYTPLLTAFCQEGVVVAAATTANSGTGVEVAASVNLAKRMLASMVGPNPRILVAGHSQGGSGANNGAAMLMANAILNVESDTQITARIQQVNGPNVESLALYGSADNLAPRSRNQASIRMNTPGPLVEAELANADHLGGGPVGQGNATNLNFRSLASAFVSAELRTDDRGKLAQQLFFGNGANTVETLGQGVVTFTSRNDKAKSLVK